MLITSLTARIERHELPDGLTALTFADSGVLSDAGDRPLPLVVVLHGLGGRKERHLDLCLRLAQAGFLACTLDARLHGDRRSPESAALEGDKQTMEFVNAFAATIHGTVEDIATLASYFGAKHYAIAGHSMGGFIALHAAQTDKRVAAVVNVSGSIDFRPPPDFDVPPEMAATAVAIDAVSRAASLWPAAVLTIQGDSDTTVPAAGAERLYELAAPAYASDPSRLELDILPGVGHEWTPEIAQKVVAWMEQHRAEIAGGV